MSTCTYHVVPQRQGPRGFVDCESHQASRFAVIERRRKRGINRKMLTFTRTLTHFSGPGAEARAAEHVAKLNKPKPARLPGIWGRSLTQAEWLAARERSK